MCFLFLSHFTLTVSRVTHGEGNGNPLQCSCLENPRDVDAWWAAVYAVAESWTRLKSHSSSSSSSGFTRISANDSVSCLLSGEFYSVVYMCIFCIHSSVNEHFRFCPCPVYYK